MVETDITLDECFAVRQLIRDHKGIPEGYQLIQEDEDALMTLYEKCGKILHDTK